MRPILVSGATGFVGSAVTRHLAEAGYSVRALTRSRSKAERLFEANAATTRLAAGGCIEVVEGDVTQPETLPAVVAGVDVVIQCAQFPGAPAENPSIGHTYMNVDRNGTLNLLGAISRVYGAPSSGPSLARFGAGAPRFLYMSGITVSEDSPHTWDRAKWQAEQAVRASGLEWTIVRSSWLFGPGDQALNRILGYSDYLPFVPLFGDGREKLTPLFIEDLARLVVLLVSHPDRARNTVFGVGGPVLLTMNEFLRTAAEIKGRRRALFHMPKPLGKIQGALMQFLPGRPLTPAAVDFASQGGASTHADRRLIAECFPEFRATPLRQALEGYLGRAGAR